jgi:hypothetical protein
MSRRRRFDWRGLVALVLALGVMATLVSGAVGAALNHERLVTAEEIATISTVLGAALGAVAVYLGTPGDRARRYYPPEGNRKGATMSEQPAERTPAEEAETVTTAAPGEEQPATLGDEGMGEEPGGEEPEAQ